MKYDVLERVMTGPGLSFCTTPVLSDEDVDLFGSYRIGEPEWQG